jgi:ribonuclease Z
MAIAAFGWVLGRGAIGEAVWRAGAREAIGRDLAADLPDGLHVFVCGSGSPMPDPSRAGPCLAVVAGTRVFVIDAGAGGAARMTRAGFPVSRIERVYLTHLHSDHFDGLGDVMLQNWVTGARPAPLPVAGPPGVERVTAGMTEAFAIDSGYRTAHHGPAVAPPSGYGLRPEPFAIPPGQDTLVLLDDAGLKITAVRVDHAPVEPAYGFRIDYKDRSVAISGDTVKSPAFIAAAKGADVMFHEALQPRMTAILGEAAKAAGDARIAKVMADIVDYHATPEQAAEAASEAGSQALVLYHLVPPLPSALLHPFFLGDAGRRFSGRITIASDGLLVSLPVGGNRVEQRRTL